MAKLDLKKLRKKMGLTQGELAQLIGVSVVYISQVERGFSSLNNFQYQLFHAFSTLSESVLKGTKDLILEGGYLFAVAKLLGEHFNLKKGK